MIQVAKLECTKDIFTSNTLFKEGTIYKAVFGLGGVLILNNGMLVKFKTETPVKTESSVKNKLMTLRYLTTIHFYHNYFSPILSGALPDKMGV